MKTLEDCYRGEIWKTIENAKLKEIQNLTLWARIIKIKLREKQKDSLMGKAAKKMFIAWK